MSKSSSLASSAAHGTRRRKRSADLFSKVCGSWATKVEKPQTLETGSALTASCPWEARGSPA
jgi:hypothetical protein